MARQLKVKTASSFVQKRSNLYVSTRNRTTHKKRPHATKKLRTLFEYSKRVDTRLTHTKVLGLMSCVLSPLSTVLLLQCSDPSPTLYFLLTTSGYALRTFYSQYIPLRFQPKNAILNTHDEIRVTNDDSRTTLSTAQLFTYSTAPLSTLYLLLSTYYPLLTTLSSLTTYVQGHSVSNIFHCVSSPITPFHPNTTTPLPP